MNKEKRVYIINCNETDFNFRKAEKEKRFNDIMTMAEELGSVYSLKGFQNAINGEIVDLNQSFILID